MKPMVGPGKDLKTMRFARSMLVCWRDCHYGFKAQFVVLVIVSNVIFVILGASVGLWTNW